MTKGHLRVPLPSSIRSVDLSRDAPNLLERFSREFQAVGAVTVIRDRRPGVARQDPRRLERLETLLKTTMERTSAVLQADRSTLFLVDRKTREIWSKVQPACPPPLAAAMQ